MSMSSVSHNSVEVKSASVSDSPTVRAEMVDYNGYLYYVSYGSVYKHGSDGNFLVIDNGTIRCITAENGCLFYLTNDNELYKTDFNGNAPALVWSYDECGLDVMSFGIRSIHAHRDVIYIIYDVICVMAYDLKTGNTVDFAEDVSTAAFAGGYMYYTDHAQRTFSIFRKNLETGETELFRGDGETFENSKEIMYDEVMSVGDEVYYTMRFPVSLYRLSPDGDDELLFTGEDNMSTCFVSGSDIFFALSDEGNGKIYKYSTAEGELSEYKVNGFFPGRGYSVLGDTLCYLDDSGDVLKAELK